MSLMHSEYAARVNHWMRVLAEDFYRPLGEIALEGYTTMEHLSPEEAARGPFRPVPEGTPWGHTWEYMWVRGEAVLPEEARDQAVVLSLDMGGEATLFVNGEPFGTRRAEWVSVPHHYLSDNVLTQKGVPGERFDLLFEVYAGHYYPDVGERATGPVLPGTLGDPKEEGRRARMGHNTFGIWNEDAYQLWLDVSTLRMLLDELPEDSLRAAKIADGLEAFTRAVDFGSSPRRGATPATGRPGSCSVPSWPAKTAPPCPACGPWATRTWTWPGCIPGTHAKPARTFAAQLRLLERYPEYRFLQSQPAAYEMCREYYPSLYEKIRRAAAEGRWIAEGAMYVEPDTNMPSGGADPAAGVRQALFQGGAGGGQPPAVAAGYLRVLRRAPSTQGSRAWITWSPRRSSGAITRAIPSPTITSPGRAWTAAR